jgi:predicted helicase
VKQKQRFKLLAFQHICDNRPDPQQGRLKLVECQSLPVNKEGAREMSGSLTQSLSSTAKNLSAHISTAADTEQEQPLWELARVWLQGVTGRPWKQEQVVDDVAQALVCMDAYVLSQGSAAPSPAAWDWLRKNANPFWTRIFQLPVVRQWLAERRLPAAFTVGNQGPEAPSFEEFLADYDPTCRTDNGVFYTPLALVRWIVQSVDQQISAAFPGSTGLAPNGNKTTEEASPSIQILDPAAGTGVFLIEVIEQVFRKMTAAWNEEGLSKTESQQRWNQYVPQCLLPRLTGFELMLPAALLGQVMIIQKLAETGFRFHEAGQLPLHVIDTLAEPAAEGVNDQPLQDHLQTLEQLRWHERFTVILGNPPFSGVSMHDVPWMGQLMRGQPPAGTSSQLSPLTNYYQVNGEPLGERKVWLQDDYVKFLRYCHWKIEQSGYGLIGLVTNHGYLDGPSFRGLRQSLHETFSSIKIVDLHGNQKKKERCPDGGPDENVFPISSGIAIGLFCRANAQAEQVTVEHSDLWGSAVQKLAALQAATTTPAKKINCSSLTPKAPYYFLLPHDDQLSDEYRSGFSLCDVMTQRSTAAVTARDGLVVGFDAQEILARLELFRDSEVSDTELRERFFTNSRSSKYPPGDTRSWKLTAARAKMSADPQWRNRLQTCFYRPFDRRSVYWAPWMIDWPRTSIMKHMLDLPNLALVARRQMLPSRPCNFFWVTDGICLDGLIRSDNRGSESIFPLYLAVEDDQGSPQPVANFSADLIAQLTDQYGWQWLSFGSGDLRQNCGPLDVFHMIYAQFHSLEYRQRYATWLRIDFPRLFLPESGELFRLLASEGEKLVQGHLLREEATGNVARFRTAEEQSDDGMMVTASFPKYQGEAIWINSDSHFEQVPLAVWEFEVGGYQVCRKWLRDRRGRQLTAEEIDQYRRLVLALSDTLQRTATIDRLIDRFGSWPEAFRGNRVSVQGEK